MDTTRELLQKKYGPALDNSGLGDETSTSNILGELQDDQKKRPTTSDFSAVNKSPTNLKKKKASPRVHQSQPVRKPVKKTKTYANDSDSDSEDSLDETNSDALEDAPEDVPERDEYVPERRISTSLNIDDL